VLALRQCATVDEVRTIADQALALELYAKQSRDTSLQRDAAEIKLRAKRRAGEMVAAVDKRPGGRSKTEHRPRLRELGVSLDESSKWQHIAAVPEQQFEAKIADARAQAKPVAWRDFVATKPRSPQTQAKYDHTAKCAQARTPGARGLDSVRVLLTQLPSDWRRMSGTSVPALLDKAINGMAHWEAGDEPVAHLQKAAAFLVLALDQALTGQSPPVTPLPETPEDCIDRRGPRPRGKRRYSAEGAPA
jgi:hypothetical protein